MTAGRSLLGLGVLTGLALALSALGLGMGVFATAAVLAFIPVPVYLAIALWIDRFEPEPRAMLATAFLWGASVAVLLSGFVNGVMDEAIGEYGSSVVTAPLAEELLKAFILFRFYRKRKDEFDGVIDGLVYAAMVGLGFAFAENVDYYGRALAKEGASGLAVTFTLRAVMAPFSHPLFTGVTGIGLGLARQTSRPWVRRLAPLAGLAGAIALHSLWNAGASAGLAFFAVYVVIMMPALLALLVTAGIALMFEGKIIRTQLAGEAASGLFSAAEFDRLCSVRGRLHASVSAFRQGGIRGWRARKAYHHAASELAFLRRRAQHDRVAADPVQEAGYLRALGAPEPAPAAPAPTASPDVTPVQPGP